MKRVLSFIFLFFLALNLSACTLYQIDSKEVGDEFHPSKLKSQVQYLETVDKSYTAIAQVIVNAERSQKMEDVIEKLKQEAAILGADAVTNITTNAGTGKWAEKKPKKLFGNANVRINYVADAIVFK